MLIFLTSIALDLSLGIAWWVTKQIAYHTVSAVTYMFSSKPAPLMLTQ